MESPEAALRCVHVIRARVGSGLPQLPSNLPSLPAKDFCNWRAERPADGALLSLTLRLSIYPLFAALRSCCSAWNIFDKPQMAVQTWPIAMC